MKTSIRLYGYQLVIVAIVTSGGYWLWQNRDQVPLVAAYLGSADKQETSGKNTRPPTPVDVAVARNGPVIVVLEAIGTAQANEAVTITSEVTGVIQRIRFEEGAKVKKGEVLVNIESGVQRAEVEVRAAEVEVRKAQLENIEQLYGRALRLSETKNIPEARVEELSAELKAAKALVHSSEAILQVARQQLVKRRVVAPFSGLVLVH